MSKFKKLFSLVLAVTLVGSLLAACGSSGTSSEPAPAPTPEAPATESTTPDTSNQYGDTGGLTLPLVDKPTTITWMLVADNPVNDKLVFTEIEKRTGIKVDVQTYSSATFQDKLKMTLASGNLPDIFSGLPPAELKKIGQQNAVVAVNDYLDILPNFKKLYVDEHPDTIKSYGDQDGKLYTWPIYGLNRDVNHGLMYRKDIFDKHGIAEWTNTEEFYQAMKKLKEHYPDSYPMASKTKESIFRDLAYGWGIGGANYPIYFDEKDSTWKFAPTSAEHKDMLDLLKKMYNEGLLDPEFLTDTQDNWAAKMTNDRAFVTWDWIGRLDMFYNQVSSQNPTYDLRYGNPIGPTGNVRTLPLIDNIFSVAVTNNDNKEAALKLLDYLTSPSGSQLVTLGVEGVNYNFDADGKPIYPELADLPLVDIKTLEERYGMWLEGMYFKPDRRSVYFNYTEKEQEAQDKILAGNKFEVLDPVLNFTDEEISTIAELQSNLMKSANEFNANYILDKNYGEADWTEWQNSAGKLGVNDLLAVYAEAQQRYDAAN